MTDKRDAVNLLDIVVSLSEEVTAKAKAAQEAIAQAFADVADPPPERKPE